MKPQGRDAVFIGICLFFILVTAGLLYSDITSVTYRQVTEEIGTIVFKKNTAERRFTAQVLWADIENSSPVYNYDSIRTDRDSAAVVYLNDGTEINLDENTLVTLSMAEKRLEVQLDGGTISAQRDSARSGVLPGALVSISSGESKIEMSEGDLTVARDESDSVNVSLASGTASVSSRGKETVIEDNRTLSIEPDGETKEKNIIFNLKTPVNSATFVTAARRYPVEFSWDDESVSGKALTVSKDPFFKRISGRVGNVSGSSHALDLEPGGYFWKLESPEGESPTYRFTILDEIPARPVSPEHGRSFTYTENFPVISFRWIAAKYSGSYRIEIFRDKALTERAAVLPSAGTSISTDTLPEGDYYWRIRNLYGAEARGDDIVSGVRFFSIAKNLGLDSPVPAQKAGYKYIVTRAALNNRNASLSWHSSAGAVEYEIEVAGDPDFKDIRAVQKTEYNFYRPAPGLEDGEYYWRVSAVSGDLRSEPSSSRIFVVKDYIPPATVFPAAGTRVASKDGITFTWSDPNRGGRYIVEISENESFEPVLLSRDARSTRIDIPSPPSGSYFWRVRLLDSDGGVVAESKISRFSVEATAPSPAIIGPFLSERFDVAELDEIPLRWRRSGDETHYRVEVYEGSVSEKNRVFNELVTGTSFNIKDLHRLSRSDYHWTVTGLKKRGKSFEPVTLAASGSFKVDLGKKISVPEISMPEVVEIE